MTDMFDQSDDMDFLPDTLFSSISVVPFPNPKEICKYSEDFLLLQIWYGLNT